MAETLTVDPTPEAEVAGEVEGVSLSAEEQDSLQVGEQIQEQHFGLSLLREHLASTSVLRFFYPNHKYRAIENPNFRVSDCGESAGWCC